MAVVGLHGPDGAAGSLSVHALPIQKQLLEPKCGLVPRRARI